MQYREYGKQGFKVSAFGMGCMRLPSSVDENGNKTVHREEAIKMIRYAADHGVNYFDSARMYFGGDCDAVLGEALSGGYREKVKVVSKIPPRFVNNEEEFISVLDDMLKKLQTDYLDVLLAHDMNREAWERFQKMGMYQWMENAKQAGKIKAIGFSFHDDLELFEEILNAADWDFCQIQLNYYDRDYQAGIKGMKMAAARGMAVGVMEPLRGGLLVDLPKNAQAVFDESGIKHSNVEWAFDWLWDMPEVSCVLSGMSTPEQLQQNIGYMQNAHPGMLSDEERKVLDQAKAALDSRAGGCED